MKPRQAARPRRVAVTARRKAPSTTPPFPVVGVGASAGGLDALSTLLREIPQDTRMAMIVVQHLAPKRESQLTTLLAGAASLPVLEARKGLRIRPGHVYVIAPDTRMRVVDGSLRVEPRASDASQYRPFDHLLSSMAEEYQGHAIGVVLSGSASDGSAGLREIKAVGGVTFAQDPVEAGFDGMPKSAIATGAVDMVLPVRGIAAELVRICRDRLLGPSTDRADLKAQEDPSLRRIFQLLQKGVGVDFAEYKLPTLLRRLQRRQMLSRSVNLTEYADTLARDPGELERLYEDMLIHVTSFFREPESYQVLRKLALPRLLAGRPADAPLRVWVPGCASGEEVYSLAMLLAECAETHEHQGFQIFGTDVSNKMIDRARAGVYAEPLLAGVSRERLARFFHGDGGQYRIKKMLRDRCVFARQDITRDPPFSKLDLIVCRNLLIYLGTPLQRRVMALFHYALRPGGVLMLGKSETAGGDESLFKPLHKRVKIYMRPPSAGDRSGGKLAAEAFRSTGAPISAQRSPAALSSETTVVRQLDQLILDRYGPPGVLVDARGVVVHTRGHTSAFLELPKGEAKLDVFKMARPGLLTALRRGLQDARTRAQPVRVEVPKVEVEGRERTIGVEVTPVGAGAQRQFLILFTTVEPPPAAPPQARAAPRLGKSARDAEVQRLQRELSASRVHLEAIIRDREDANEELQAANEEILSSNEELQSTNEELDTAREELQSTNEELSTLNDELQGRNDELLRANSDLVNLLASVQIPIVMVTSDLRIRRFTPAAEKVLNLIAADVGRPIGHLKPNIVCPNLEPLIEEVIQTVSVRELEVQDREGASFILRIRPYKDLNNRIEGALLTLYDISALRGQEAALALARQTGEAVMSLSPQPMLLLDANLKVERANPAFYDTFKVSPRQTEARFIYDLGGRQWDVPAFRSLLEEILPHKRNFDDYVIDGTFPGLGHRRLSVTGRRIESPPAGGVILLTFRDLDGAPRAA